MTIKVVCWNIKKLRKTWPELLDMDADVALLQEVGSIPDGVFEKRGVQVGPREHWDSHTWLAGDNRYDRWPMIVKLSDRVEIEWFNQVAPISETKKNEIAVSGIGTIAAARVIPKNGQPFIAVSMYARWIRWHPSVKTNWKVGYQDGSAHRIISDLSAFIGSYAPSSHRILAAGDLNASFSSSDPHDRRNQTILDRLESLGLVYLGPTYPNGRRATTVPSHLTEESLDVPTYHSVKQNPATASDQLDHVFASDGFAENVKTGALNSIAEWGPSDHCRLLIDVECY